MKNIKQETTEESLEEIPIFASDHNQTLTARLIAYFLFAVVAFGFCNAVFDTIGLSPSLVYTFFYIKKFIIHFFFGLYRHMWYHAPPEMRMSMFDTIFMYWILFVLAVLVLGYMFRKSSNEDIVVSMLSATVGVLISLVTISLLLIPPFIDHESYTQFYRLVVNPITIMMAMVLCTVSLNRLPFCKFELNRLAVCAAFVTSFLFSTVGFLVINYTIKYEYVMNGYNSKGLLLNPADPFISYSMNLAAVISSILLAYGVLRLFKVRRWIMRFEALVETNADYVSYEIEDVVPSSLEDDEIKRRILN